MKYDIMMYCPAWCYCTVEADSEEELKEALLHKRYEIYDEYIGETERYFITAIDDEDASCDCYLPELFLNSKEKE